ncbi:hypothetical protein T4B_6607, partial [Trichinella pseudospiralis]
LQLHRRDEQPDKHMHCTYPWQQVALVTTVLRGISASDTSSIDNNFSVLTCKSATANFNDNYPSPQPTVHNPLHSAMIATRKIFRSSAARSTSGTLSAHMKPI